MEQEFAEVDRSGSWSTLYQDIRHQASDFPCKVAKLPENRNRNRYRDVSPFDHSRIKLQQGDNDYVNASLIKMEEAQRSYILTQGPLPNTCGHFWEMVWEQKSRGVVMLNRLIEKGSIKCAQYWPSQEEVDMIFPDTHFKLTLISEDVKSYYTVRQLEVENLATKETREILHFHYTTWPDFGVPESPASFLNFLFKVRESGSLNPEHGPIMVHCSAGIGRSGTFSLVDTCLLLMDKRKEPLSVDVKQVLLEMRKYRMGLIQTADQMRFSYMAIIEGAKFIMGDPSVQEQWKELSNEDLAPPPEHSPPPPRPPKRAAETPNGKTPDQRVCFINPDERTCEQKTEDIPDGRMSQLTKSQAESSEPRLRKRHIGDNVPIQTNEQDLQGRSEKNEEVVEENSWLHWKPCMVNTIFLQALAFCHGMISEI
ncbi:tyrosine-protein phosphatase non-receptor type 1-like isoform X2 [Narcine bancroftii]|uniref:tyrosine-protein phosphatase non-receptor type 1-like isoform X2 n=1 Tax=Narcine bancroftii TaxID=1343680 RepID=UPI00383149FF